MSETKEFQGKNLDEAIEAACKHFDLKRDKLEIEIVSGGSSGIFGLVGVKKAVVRAKPRGSFKPASEAPERTAKAERPERAERRSEPVERAEKAERPERPERVERPERAEARPAPRTEAEPKAEVQPEARKEQTEGDEPRRSERSRRGRGRGRGDRSGERSADKPVETAPEADGNRAPAPRRRERPRHEAEGNRAPRSEAVNGALPDDDESGAPRGIGHLDQALLEAVAREATGKLLEHLVENAKISVELLHDRVCVRIEDPDNTGLLIGREGQTLASIQYLVNRLVSKRMDASVRVQIDAGDYRESQDERLRQIARHLADKAMSSGRTQSTRPMSSYHRRVVHLTLQDDEHVFTRSKGEGSMKRVLIMPKRRGKDGVMLEEIPQDAAQEFNDSSGE